MRLESALALKLQLVREIIEPFAVRTNRLRDTGASAVPTNGAAADDESQRIVFGVGARPFETLPLIQRSIALGIAREGGEYRVAIRVQRPALLNSPIVEKIKVAASGEVDVRMIGRLDKRTKRRRVSSRPVTAPRAAPGAPWYQRNTRPLMIGASVGHVDITAGTTGAFVTRAGRTCLLSNNHVLANEDKGKAGDWVLQRGPYDGGRQPADRVARLDSWVRLKPKSANLVDAALARIETAIKHDARTLRGITGTGDRVLVGPGPASIEAGATVYKVGRTTGGTQGRVTAFALDNLVVNYDRGNLRFDDQVEIEGTGNLPFSDGGDSGSLIVDSGMLAAALLFAGGDTGGANGMGLTFANPINTVLKALKATLLF
jgi:hypothetical protein